MMYFLMLAGVAALANGAAIEKRALQQMDDLSLTSFTRMFRGTLLDKVAVEWNVTVEQSNTLKARMVTCRATLKTQTDRCKADAQSTCQPGESPDVTDYMMALVNPYSLLKGPLNDMASKLGDVVDLLGDGGAGFIHSMSGLADSVGGSATDAFHGLKDGLGKLGDVFSGAGSLAIDTAGLLGDGLKGIGDGISHTVTDLGHSISHGLGSIGHSLGHIFGKREIDADTRRCMERCSSCRPLLLPQSQMIASVCGDDITPLNNTINVRVSKIKAIYDTALDKQHPVLSKLEYDKTSMTGNMELSRVFVTVRLNGRDVRYQTAVPYEMMNLPLTAKNIALEFWSKFQ